MSVDPESSTGKFSLPVHFTFGTNTLFRRVRHLNSFLF
jgi:hypothetical protein